LSDTRTRCSVSTTMLSPASVSTWMTLRVIESRRPGRASRESSGMVRTSESANGPGSSMAKVVVVSIVTGSRYKRSV